MLNERQTKLIADLQEAFGKMNGSTTAKGRLLDIQAIRNMMDESEAIKKEVELYNEKLRGEFRCKWTSELDMLTDDLEELGLSVKMQGEEMFVQHMGLHYDSYGKEGSCLTQVMLGGWTNQFIIKPRITVKYIDLPNGERINKIVCYYYELGTNNYFDSIEKLVSSELFKEWINYSLVQNNMFKK